MEERRTAVWVLGIIAVISFVLIKCWPGNVKQRPTLLSFRGCKVPIDYFDEIYDHDVYRAAQNKLGLCLCKLYQQHPDTLLRNRIIEINKHYGNNYLYDSTFINNNIDSIIKHRTEVLDTTIVID